MQGRVRWGGMAVVRATRRWIGVLVLAGLLGGCRASQTAVVSESPRPGAASGAPASPDPTSGPPLFTDITDRVGIDFVHHNGMTGDLYFVEMMGAGGAMLDFDDDGDLDLYLVQGGSLEPGPGGGEAVVDEAAADTASPRAATDPAVAGGDARRGRLYRNELTEGPDGRPLPRFTDVTATSGITATGYGMGVATGDYDNDGRTDLYLTHWGSNQLWRNRGDGTFEDVTARAGADDPRWSVGASFLDYDRDGWLDLYVANYVAYSLANHHACYSRTGSEDYCSPKAYRPERDKLLRNQGDGTFEDVTDRVGMTDNAGPGLGVVAADVDGDGWVDVYVANDQAENFLWHNRAGERFENIAPMSGAAVDREGRPEASMGVNASDFDGDGDLDLFLTHLRDETNTLYTNESVAGDGKAGGGAGGVVVFRDTSDDQPLGPISLPYTGFGTSDLDFDNDGWLDLAVVNGEVVLNPAQVAAGDPFPLKQTPLLFRNRGDGVFEDVTARGGPAFGTPAVGRGLAAGDIDNDGDTDLLVTSNNGPARLLRNDAGGAPWLGLRLVGTAGRRDMLGAVVRLLPGGPPSRPVIRLLHTDGSYASASDPRVLVGLGAAGGDQTVEITWPDGSRETWRGLAPGAYHTLVQGEAP